MALTIANEDATSYPAMASPDSGDFFIIGGGFDGNGVVSGCLPTAQGTPNMTVAVSSGQVLVNRQLVAVAGGNATITTAHATLPRIDLVTVNSSGTIAVFGGTAAAAPEFPNVALWGSTVVLAAVYVPAADTSIDGAQIFDRRLMLSPRPLAPKSSDYSAVPPAGWEYYNTTSGRIRVSTGVAWTDAGLTGPAGPVGGQEIVATSATSAQTLTAASINDLTTLGNITVPAGVDYDFNFYLYLLLVTNSSFTPGNKSFSLAITDTSNNIFYNEAINNYYVSLVNGNNLFVISRTLRMNALAASTTFKVRVAAPAADANVTSMQIFASANGPIYFRAMSR